MLSRSSRLVRYRSRIWDALECIATAKELTVGASIACRYSDVATALVTTYVYSTLLDSWKRQELKGIR
jgi:hypothetical protein